MFKGNLACIRNFVESDDKIRVMWNVGDVGMLGCWVREILETWILEMWFVEDVRSLGCGMLRIWDVRGVGCLGCWGCGMLGMWDVLDVGCSGCGMLGMWDVGCGVFTGILDIDLQNANFKTLFHKSLRKTFKFLSPIALSTFLFDFFLT